MEEPTAICCNISVWELAITLNTVAAGTLGWAPGRKIVFLIRDETAGRAAVTSKLGPGSEPSLNMYSLLAAEGASGRYFVFCTVLNGSLWCVALHEKAALCGADVWDGILNHLYLYLYPARATDGVACLVEIFK